MKYNILFVLFLLLSIVPPAIAQSDNALGYSEVVSGVFAADETTHEWTFSGAERDIIQITARRIRGVATPRISLSTADGNPLTPAQTEETSTTQTLWFYEGLPASGDYVISIHGENIQADVINPDEYSLELLKLGERKADPEAGLTIPRVDAPPTLENGTPATRDDERGRILDVAFYGSVNITRPNPGGRPAYYFLNSDSLDITELYDGNVMSRVVRSFTFLDEGIGITANNGQIFFTDQKIAYAENDNSSLTLRLDNGQQIITDFFQISQIQAVEGLLSIQTSSGQAIILQGTNFELRQAGNNNTELRIIVDGQTLLTDLNGWDTLAYDGNQLAVLYGADLRIISDNANLTLLQSIETSILNVTLALADSRTIPLTIDPFMMGDIVIQGDSLTITPLDERTLAESISNLSGVLIEAGAVRFSRADGSYRLSLMDRTEIETPANPATNAEALPHQAGYIPTNANNLGREFVTSCPCIELPHDSLPINPVNGNLYYAVTDFSVPSHTLQLEFTRHYNSQGVDMSPAYMRPFFGQMGDGWRHTYQIELDIINAPLGNITLIEPDGTRHIFRQPADGSQRFTSRTLRTWIVERQSGLTGSWKATHTSGLTYEFDRSGQLTRIMDANGDTLDFSPMPREYLTETGETGGFFVIEPYGRRLEVYTNDSQQVVRVRNADDFQITYHYDDQLTGVNYVDSAQTASYTYENGQLTRLSDPFSPYHPRMTFTYDEVGRVENITEDPDGLARLTNYAYNQGTELTVSQTMFVSGTARIHTWTVNGSKQVTRHNLPREGWYYNYTYEEATGALDIYRTAQGGQINFNYNAQGQIIAIVDPIYTTSGQTAFTYTTFEDGHQQRVDQVTYGNGGYDQFIYDEINPRRLIEWRQLISSGQNRVERITRYEYDEFGRIAAMIAPGDVVTRYEYDQFGYVSRITEGNESRTLLFTHDPVGRLRSITDGRGISTVINWNDARNIISSIQAPLDYAVRYTYDEWNNLIGVNDRGAETQYIFDGLENITTVTDPVGRVTNYDYDEAGNITRVLLQDGESAWTYAYDALNDLTSVTTPTGLITTYTSTVTPETGNLTREVIDPQQRRVRYTYDVLGRLREVSMFDRNGQPTYDYDIGYDIRGNLISVSETHVPNGRTLSLEYDLVGNVTRSAVNQSRTSYEYDINNNLISVTNSAGQVTRYTYDNLDNIESITLPGEGATFTYARDENGNITSITNPMGESTTYVYDDLSRITSVIDPLGRQVDYGYDPRSNLINMIDANGNTHTAEYDTLDRLSSTTDGLGEDTRYTYDVLGRLAEITAPRGLFTRYTYSTANNVVAITRPNNFNFLFGYDSLGRVTSVTDTLGRTTVYDYNRLGRLNRVVNPFGDEINYGWSSSGRLLNFTDFAERVYEYNTDEFGRLTQIRDVTTDSTFAINSRFRYDDVGNITQVRFGTSGNIEGSNAAVYTYAYDERNQIIAYTDPENKQWRFNRDAAGRITTVTDPNGSITNFVYDAGGQITQIIRASTTEQETREYYTYDANGNVIEYTDPLGIVTTYVYDSGDRLVQRNVDSRSTIYEYDALGYISAITDAAGLRTEYRYDVFGNLLSVTQPLQINEEETRNIIWQYQYDDVHNLTDILYPAAIDARASIAAGTITAANAEEAEQVTQMSYNALNLRVRYVDNEDKVWAYTYDNNGNLLQISDPLGSVTRYEYDTMGRVERIIYANNSIVRFRYDDNGSLNQVLGADTEVRTFPRPNEEAINAQSVTLTYDLDRMGRLTAITDVDSSATTYTYDDMGNLATRRDAEGRTTTYAYDALNRLVNISSPDGNISRAYDANSNITAVTSNMGTYEFDYNPFGEIISSNAPSLQMDFERDAVGNIIQRTTNSYGDTQYTYDNLHRLIRVDYDGAWVEFDYNVNGWRTEIRRSSGITTRYDYDNNGRPITITHLNAENRPIDILVYTYNDVGDISRINRQDWRILYSYDTTHQIIDERWLDGENRTRYSINLDYDDAGNRIETFIRPQGEDQTRTLYVYDRENQLIEEIRNYVPPDLQVNLGLPLMIMLFGGGFVFTRRQNRRWFVLSMLPFALVGGVTTLAQQNSEPYHIQYAYDRNGNLTSITHPQETGIRLTFGYDVENRLVSVQGTNENGAAINTRYAYDPFNRLSRLTILESPSRDKTYEMLYDGDTIIAMRDTTNGDIERYIQVFPGERLMTIGFDGEVRWHLNDSLNNLRKYGTAEGTAPEIGFNYNAFGELILPYGTDAQPELGTQPTVLFTGAVYDPSTGLYLMGMRAYHSRIGRFIQRDALRHDPFGTLYTYAYNRPNTYIDPSGMIPEAAFQATTAINIPNEIQPQTAPNPLLLDIPMPPSVRELQAEEDFRVLKLGLEIRAQLNPMLTLVDPFGRDFYMNWGNAVPDMVHDLLDTETLRITQTYTSGEGWTTLPEPDPSTPPDPFALFESVEPLLSIGYDMDFCTSDSARYIPLPDVPELSPYSAQNISKAALVTTLQEIPLLPGIGVEVGTLTQPRPSFPNPAIEEQADALPYIPIEPIVLKDIHALREQLAAFYAEVFLTR